MNPNSIRKEKKVYDLRKLEEDWEHQLEKIKEDERARYPTSNPRHNFI